MIIDFNIKKGNIGNLESSPGDLLIKVNIKPDPYYKREGFDIYTDCKLSIPDVIMTFYLISEWLYDNIQAVFGGNQSIN